MTKFPENFRNYISTPIKNLNFKIISSRAEGLRLIVTKIGGGELRPRPGVDPSCVTRLSNSAIRDLNTYNKRKEPDTLSSERDAKR